MEILTLIPTWPELVRGVPDTEGGKAIIQGSPVHVFLRNMLKGYAYAAGGSGCRRSGSVAQSMRSPSKH